MKNVPPGKAVAHDVRLKTVYEATDARSSTNRREWVTYTLYSNKISAPVVSPLLSRARWSFPPSDITPPAVGGTTCARIDRTTTAYVTVYCSIIRDEVAINARLTEFRNNCATNYLFSSLTFPWCGTQSTGSRSRLPTFRARSGIGRRGHTLTAVISVRLATTSGTVS